MLMVAVLLQMQPKLITTVSLALLFMFLEIVGGILRSSGQQVSIIYAHAHCLSGVHMSASDCIGPEPPRSVALRHTLATKMQLWCHSSVRNIVSALTLPASCSRAILTDAAHLPSDVSGFGAALSAGFYSTLRHGTPVENTSTSTGPEDMRKPCILSMYSPKRVGLQGQPCCTPVCDCTIFPDLPLILIASPLFSYKDCTAASIGPCTPRRCNTCHNRGCCTLS